MLHRLGGEIECGKLISFVSHPYEHYVVDPFLYECRLLNGVLEPRAVHSFKWVASSDFDQYLHPGRRGFDEQAARRDLTSGRHARCSMYLRGRIVTRR